MACKSDPQSLENVADTDGSSSKMTTADIGALGYKDYVLSSKSEEAVLDWQKYLDLQTNIELLKNGDLSFFRVEREIMLEFIVELKNGQPPVLLTPAIRSRLTVLETNLQRLQNLANLDNIKKKELLLAIKELLIANVNLKLQINKKFEKEAQQIQLPYSTVN